MVKSSYMKTTIYGKLHQNLRGAVHLLCQMRCIDPCVVCVCVCVCVYVCVCVSVVCGIVQHHTFYSWHDD